MCSFFFREFQLITVTFLIHDSYMNWSWSTRFVSLKKCVGFSIFFSQYSNNEQPVPLVFLADETFPLSQNCMKPFSTKHLLEKMRIFNYRLSWFIWVSQNAFCIWTNTFRLFSTRALLIPEKAKPII